MKKTIQMDVEICLRKDIQIVTTQGIMAKILIVTANTIICLSNGATAPMVFDMEGHAYNLMDGDLVKRNGIEAMRIDFKATYALQGGRI